MFFESHQKCAIYGAEYGNSLDSFLIFNIWSPGVFVI